MRGANIVTSHILILKKVRKVVFLHVIFPISKKSIHTFTKP